MKKLIPERYFDLLYIREGTSMGTTGKGIAGNDFTFVPPTPNAMRHFYASNIKDVASVFQISAVKLICIKFLYLAVFVSYFLSYIYALTILDYSSIVDSPIVIYGSVFLIGIGLFLVPFTLLPYLFVRLLLLLRILKFIPPDSPINLHDRYNG